MLLVTRSIEKAKQKESSPDVWPFNTIAEHKYGDVYQPWNTRKLRPLSACVLDSLSECIAINAFKISAKWLKLMTNLISLGLLILYRKFKHAGNGLRVV
jgi:hypothetical protein